LTESLIQLGHQVTLFASGDSTTAAELHATCPKALRFDSSITDPLVFHMLQLEDVRCRAHEFDVIHFHTDYRHLPMLRDLGTPSVTTMHGRLDIAGYPALFDAHRDCALVSISDHQRGPLPEADWIGRVHHGLPADLCEFNPHPRGDYVAFLGRISPEKRVDRAIEIARRAGVKLVIAAKVDSADRRYFHREIEPLLSQPHVEFVGEIGEGDKCEFLGNARALLFPIDWPEPFGLVMIESMSCGTPCIAWRAGSVPEVIEEGRSGFIVDTLDGAVDAVHRSWRVDRTAVRASFRRRFSVERMTRDYLAIYQRLLSRRTRRAAA
jgi:glycosyltransferase involved in cell wall biosynthesis